MLETEKFIRERRDGLLPTVLSFDEYKTRYINKVTGRTAVPEDEAFLRFHVLRCREQGTSLPPADTQRLLSFLTTIAEFSVNTGELSALDRIAPEHIERIDRFFATMETFRAVLAAEGQFYPPFEEALFNDLTSHNNELFVGLPLMTPVNERFFGRIPRERLFVNAPLFGPNMPTEEPDYETALSLVRRIGVAERRNKGKGLEFTELAERAALPALLAREIDLVISCPPTRHPCPYGIDFSSQGELIAAQKGEVDEIARFIGLDSLYYLSLPGMVEATQMPAEAFCLACYTGDYPLPPPPVMEKLCFES